MSNKYKLLLVGGLAAFVALLMLFTNVGIDNRTAEPTYVSADWSKKYGLKDLEPKGLFLFSKFLSERLTDRSAIYPITNAQTIDSVVDSDATFFFIGENFALKDRELQNMIEKVELGNTLFLSCEHMSQNVIDMFFEYFTMTYEYESKSTVHVLDEIAPFRNNKQKFFSFNAVFQNDTITREWPVFDEITIIGEKLNLLSAIGKEGEYPNFIAIKRGKGKIYLHTMPETLLNYQLLKWDGAQHAKFVLKAFPKCKNAYWLDFAQLTHLKEEPNYDHFSDDDKVRDESYLQFLFSNANLRTAMLLAFFGCILFFVFRFKRQRPIIPLKMKRRNTSVEFSRTVASIFMSRQNPHGLLQLQKKNFYDLITRYFFIDLNLKDNNRERAIESLSKKANVPAHEIHKLLQLLETNVKINVDEPYLFEVNRRIKLFIASAGIQQGTLSHGINKFEGTIKRELLVSSIALISGLLVFLFGFWLLTKGVGTGAVCLPIATVIIFVAIRRFSLPVLQYQAKALIYYPLFANKREYLWKDLLNVENDQNSLQFYFKEGQKLKIKWSEISRFDQVHFERFVNNYLKYNK
ncbi:MAG: hypothetical protein ACK50Y_11970 [Flavobacteriia bacterium]